MSLIGRGSSTGKQSPRPGSVLIQVFSWVSAKVTQGQKYVDPQGKRNLEQAKAAGITAVGYHFASPAPVMLAIEAQHEAQHYLEHHPGGPFVLDWEATSSPDHPLDRVSGADQLRYLTTWMDWLRIDSDAPVVVYCDLDIAHELATAARGGPNHDPVELPYLWLAHWTAPAGCEPKDAPKWDGSPWQHTAWKQVVWWQWTDLGHVGPLSSVDLDVAVNDLTVGS